MPRLATWSSYRCGSGSRNGGERGRYPGRSPGLADSGRLMRAVAVATAAPVRRSLLRAVVGFGVLAGGACLLAPLVGSTSISLRRVFDPSVAVRRQRRRADLLRREAAARPRGGIRRQRAGGGGRRVPGVAPQSAGDALYARRLCRRGARGDAGDHVQRGALGCPGGQRAGRELRRLDGGRRDRLCAGERASPGLFDQRDAAGRRDDELVLLGRDPLRPGTSPT